jgi:hypothetical protein
MAVPTEDLEVYLVQRKRRRRMLLAAGVVVFIGIVAVPYALMNAGLLKKDTFEIFVAVDIFVAIGLIRGFVTKVKDSAF